MNQAIKLTNLSITISSQKNAIYTVLIKQPRMHQLLHANSICKEQTWQPLKNKCV